MKTVLLLGRKYSAGLALKYLLENEYEIVGAVAMDEVQNQQSTHCGLMSIAEGHGVPLYDHLNIYELIDESKRTFDGREIDIVVSYLYPLKIKIELLNIAKIATINFHPAPLPEYQGVGGYNAAIMDELDYFGVTAHLMIEKIDAGEILKVEKFNISTEETAYSLEQTSMQVMFNLFKEIFSDTFDMYLMKRYINDIASGRYITREDFEKMKFIEAGDSKEIIDKKIRAFWYPPYEGAKVKLDDQFYTVVNNELLQEISKKYNATGQNSN